METFLYILFIIMLAAFGILLAVWLLSLLFKGVGAFAELFSALHKR